jgi:hypothetical protein
MGSAASRTGASFFASAATRDAVVLWDPLLCPAVIPAMAAGTPPFPSALPFHPWHDAIQTAIVRDTAGREHVRLCHGGRTVQLAVSGARVLNSPYLLTELAVPEHIGARRLAAIAAFHRLCQRKTSAGLPSTDTMASARLHLVLQALDGYLAAASQREIAIALFGRRRTDSEWRDPGGYMRDRVRRAVARGRQMMTSGYRELLRR